MLYLMLALTPAEVESVTMEVRGETVRAARGAEGRWKAVDVESRRGWHLQLDEARLLVSEGGQPDAVDVSAHVAVDGVDWSAGESINTAVDGVTLLFERRDTGLTVLRVDGERRDVLATIRFGIDGAAMVRQDAQE